MKPIEGEFATYSWWALIHPSASGSVRKTTECNSQIFSYRWRSWDALVIMASSAETRQLGETERYRGSKTCNLFTIHFPDRSNAEPNPNHFFCTPIGAQAMMRTLDTCTRLDRYQMPCASCAFIQSYPLCSVHLNSYASSLARNCTLLEFIQSYTISSFIP